VLVPTIVLLAHIVKPPSFSQRQEDFEPQEPLPISKSKSAKEVQNNLGVEMGQESNTNPHLSFRGQILQAMAWCPILRELCATHLGRSKKFCNCRFRSIIFLYQSQTPNGYIISKWWIT